MNTITNKSYTILFTKECFRFEEETEENVIESNQIRMEIIIKSQLTADWIYKQALGKLPGAWYLGLNRIYGCCQLATSGNN